MLEKIEGIILKTQDFRETHKIVTIFGKHIGKFTAVARGAKKPKSRMAAMTQPFIYGNFLVYLGSGLGTIQQGEIIESFRPIREDIYKTAYAAYLAELTYKMIEDKNPQDFLLYELYQTMHWIAEKDEVEIPIMMYELKMYEVGGFSPVLDRCVRCSNKQFPFAFSIKEGGLLCTKCRHVDGDAIFLSETLVKLLYLFSHVSLNRIGNISVKPENTLLFRRLLDAYYDHYGGYYLKTRRFLKQIEKL
ncbi:DNA repair protein RecO (recombination protein O) [Cerasibacillus quisquiliarum]|uniref:DNA repair protein RecO n=1 Tax=Cerasibacillus quisquiliarum TaxID=227865 RepID=A0A511V153_9BACI|nr:DNA repair protein RecO [Cerasibacillus quisquiliarum]MBB5145532.1 DNA repair protein RecO (recombination protein O) [Cerasibacillus quisquiliarum]GEN31072.1 DNA repair protein RecO [Cerasibacillus quisquiliarum]